MNKKILIFSAAVAVIAAYILYSGHKEEKINDIAANQQITTSQLQENNFSGVLGVSEVLKNQENKIIDNFTEDIAKDNIASTESDRNNKEIENESEITEWAKNIFESNQNQNKSSINKIEKNQNKEESINTSENTHNSPSQIILFFYKCLEDPSKYTEAIDLLHEDFTIELSILKQFGINQLNKNDINLEEASSYSIFLTLAKIEEILYEESFDDITVIKYKHNITFNENCLTMIMEAIISIQPEGFKILSIKEI